ncbi:MAG: acetolactate decarboxylase [Acidobacteriota bacterium]
MSQTAGETQSVDESAGEAAAGGALDRETLTQVSSLSALVEGVYDGFLPLERVAELGDFGLGTFAHLDGEMVQLDGVIYQVDAKGQVNEPPPSVRSPFFVTTFFDPDLEFELVGELDFEGLRTTLDERLPSVNYPWAIRVTGTMKSLKTRSVPAQQVPYPPLATVVETQPTFEFETVSGTLVGFRLPAFLAGANAAGYHFHFVDAARSGGGHVLEVTLAEATVEADLTPKISILLPEDSQAFADFGAGDDFGDDGE